MLTTLHISRESRQLAMCQFVVQDSPEVAPPQLPSSDHEKKQVASDEGKVNSPVKVNEYTGAGAAGVSFSCVSFFLYVFPLPIFLINFSSYISASYSWLPSAKLLLLPVDASGRCELALLCQTVIWQAQDSNAGFTACYISSPSYEWVTLQAHL